MYALYGVGFDIGCGHGVCAVYAVELFAYHYKIMCGWHIVVRHDVALVGIYIYYAGRVGCFDVRTIVDSGIVGTIAIAGCQ